MMSKHKKTATSNINLYVLHDTRPHHTKVNCADKISQMFSIILIDRKNRDKYTSSPCKL
uniref:Uncharacterized protein n=1 Tax=Arundo donax TaxID=35708 RepID=A0A0A9BB85_ARUDO